MGSPLTRQTLSNVPFIRVQRLEKNFRDISVLHGVDLSVERGTLVSIIGRSGCGKSTLLRCLNCLEIFDRGHVEIAGIIESALASMHADGITGQGVTPYLLRRVVDETDGRSLVANLALVRHNAATAAAIAVEYASLQR